MIRGAGSAAQCECARKAVLLIRCPTTACTPESSSRQLWMYPNFTHQVAYHPVGHLISTPGSSSRPLWMYPNFTYQVPYHPVGHLIVKREHPTYGVTSIRLISPYCLTEMTFRVEPRPEDHSIQQHQSRALFVRSHRGQQRVKFPPRRI